MRRCPQSLLEHLSVGSLPALPFLTLRGSASWRPSTLSSIASWALVPSGNRAYSANIEATPFSDPRSLFRAPPRQVHRRSWSLRNKSQPSCSTSSRRTHSQTRNQEFLDTARKEEPFTVLEDGSRRLDDHRPELLLASKRPLPFEEHHIKLDAKRADTSASQNDIQGSTPSAGQLSLSSARRSTDAGDYDAALQDLSNAVEYGVNTTSDSFMRACNSLIRKGRNHEGSYQKTSHVVDTFIGMGVNLDITSYNILMLNSREAGDPKTAWDIYELICRNGMEPNDYTWTILLKTSRKANNRKWFRKIYKHMQYQGLESLSRPLVTELLMTWYRFGRRSGFDRLLRCYEQHCDLQILRDLGMVHPEHQPRSPLRSTDKSSSSTLVVMLLAYVRAEQSVLRAAETYRVFQRLLVEHHPLIVPLGEQTLVYSIFLKAFGNKPGSLKLWPRLLRDMAQSLGPEVINKDTGQPFRGCKPNAIFWNILLNAFARAGQLAAAERVIELMRQQEFTPDKYSWTSLAGGYAKQQNIEETVGVLRRMQEDNVAGDERTVKTLQIINDRPKLLDLMQHLVKGQTFDLERTGTDGLDDELETTIGLGDDDDDDRTEQVDA